MKRFLFIMPLALLVLSAACSSYYSGEQSIFNTSDSAAADTDAGYSGMDAERERAAALSAVDESRKIIWNASLDIRAKDANELHWTLAARAAELGGYELTNSIEHQEWGSTVSATYKIPPRHIHTFIAFAGEQGRVINSRLGSDDITEKYFDSAQRLQTKRATLEPYYRLLADAKNIDEILKLQRIIDDITEDIEVLEGRLRLWDTQADMATVEVHIRQDNDPVAVRREISWSSMSLDDMGYFIQVGFTTVCRGILTILQWLLVAIIVTSPLWAPVLIIGLAIWKLAKRAAKKKREKPGGPADDGIWDAGRLDTTKEE
jgi:hypothetical protein